MISVKFGCIHGNVELPRHNSLVCRFCLAAEELALIRNTSAGTILKLHAMNVSAYIFFDKKVFDPVFVLNNYTKRLLLFTPLLWGDSLKSNANVSLSENFWIQQVWNNRWSRGIWQMGKQSETAHIPCLCHYNLWTHARLSRERKQNIMYTPHWQVCL